MIHLNIQQFFYAFIMGVIFSLFVYYSRSLYAGVLAHFCVNAFQLILDRVWPYIFPETGPGQESFALLLARLAQISLIFLPAIIILFRTFLSHNRKRNGRRDLLKAMRIPRTDETEPAAAPEETKPEPPPDETEPAPPGAAVIIPPRARLLDIYFWLTAAVYAGYTVLLMSV
jgi:hypothetical protein